MSTKLFFYLERQSVVAIEIEGSRTLSEENFPESKVQLLWRIFGQIANLLLRLVILVQ